MKMIRLIIVMVMALIFLISCAATHSQRYNTQRVAAFGAGVGALAGQILGHDAESTLIGAGVGTLVGALVGNAIDQQHQAVREAALTNKRVVYYANNKHAIEAIPGPVDQHTKCRKVTKREWDRGHLVSERVEEVCEGERFSEDY
jgi:uncharacterized protein YcfJ